MIVKYRFEVGEQLPQHTDDVFKVLGDDRAPMVYGYDASIRTSITKMWGLPHATGCLEPLLPIQFEFANPM
jgi:hypothetical protein